MFDSITLVKIRGALKYIVLYSIFELGRAHGYELRQYIAKLFNLKYVPSNGILYPTLHELEKEGFLISYSEGRKRVYELTSKGIDYIHVNKQEIHSTIGKIRTMFSIINRLNIDKLINVVQTLWEKNVIIPNHVVEALSKKVLEIIEILNTQLESNYKKCDINQ
ncbi:MAG: PadR family transcriptional regulator [Ignisphaera sp.]|uniref:PadR family transcriptional regulator n=1 Tax=Ignisphaera aggregans TaxID=334771 RepID=A0A7J3N0I1_9CREN